MIRVSAKTRILTFVLLGLISHGILSVAHTHPAFSHKDNASASIIITDDDGQSGHSPSTNHSQCPLCQLQRIFTTGLRSPSIILELPSEYLDREFSPAESISRGPVLVLSDRAPPLA